MRWSYAWQRVRGAQAETPASDSARSIAQLIVVSYRAAILAIVSRLVIVPPYAVRPRCLVSHGREFAWCHLSTKFQAPPGTTRQDLAGFS